MFTAMSQHFTSRAYIKSEQIARKLCPAMRPISISQWVNKQRILLYLRRTAIESQYLKLKLLVSIGGCHFPHIASINFYIKRTHDFGCLIGRQGCVISHH